MPAGRLWLLVPLALIAAIVAFLLLGRPLNDLTQSAPPVEELVVEATRLSPGLISLSVRGDGSEPIHIAQVQVDGAYRPFTATPSGAIGRLDAARIDIPYPWIEGEAHHILFVTATGATFEHSIEVAVPEPEWTATTFGELILIGLLLGIAPVAIGLLAYPAMRSFGPAGLQFVLALTVGLLLYPVRRHARPRASKPAPRRSTGCAARPSSGSPWA